MNGKNKCKILKEIRQKIADENDIPYVTRECTYQGACKGTCPKCEEDLRYLETELERRKNLGKTIAVAAVAASITLALSACVPGDGNGAKVPGGTAPATTANAPDPSEKSEPTEGSGGTDSTEPIEIEGDIEYIPDNTPELAGDVEYIPRDTN